RHAGYDLRRCQYDRDLEPGRGRLELVIRRERTVAFGFGGLGARCKLLAAFLCLRLAFIARGRLAPFVDALRDDRLCLAVRAGELELSFFRRCAGGRQAYRLRLEKGPQVRSLDVAAERLCLRALAQRLG